jgi:hypothetical protein
MRALVLLLVLLAGQASADVAWISFDVCAGGNHVSNVTVGNVLRETRNGSMSNGGAVVTSSGFVAADIGRTMIVHGAGVSGRSLICTIASRTTTQATCGGGVTASTAVTNATVLVMGATQVIPDDDSDDAVTFRLWLNRQLARGKTRLQALGHIVIRDVP